MEAIGLVLIVLSIPLIFRWIPRNRFFGFRVPPTYTNESVWYDANALCGRHLLLLGLLMVTLEFLLSKQMRTPVLGTIGWIGVVGITAADWRTANRWRREREKTVDPLSESQLPAGHRVPSTTSERSGPDGWISSWFLGGQNEDVA